MEILDNDLIVKEGAYPEKLVELAQKWAKEGKTFCLSPENIFEYKFLNLDYSGSADVEKDLAAWKIRTPECLLPNRLSKSEIDEIAYYFGKDEAFEFAIIMIGAKCNLKCKFCFYHGDNNSIWNSDFSEQCVELDLDVIFTRIDKLKQIGVKKIQLVPNGELFIYKDWYNIVRYAKENDLEIKILFSNGTMLTEENIKKLSELEIETISISLNAFTPQTWGLVSRVKNIKIFDTVFNAPALAKKYGLQTEVSYVVCNENMHEIESFIAYWVDKVDIVKLCNEISAEEFLLKSKNINNSSLPYYLCNDLRGRMVVTNNGYVFPCCSLVNVFDDHNTTNMPLINFDELSPDEIVRQMNINYKNKNYRNVCIKCPLVRIGKSEGIKTSIYGYSGVYVGGYFFADVKK